MSKLILRAFEKIEYLFYIPLVFITMFLVLNIMCLEMKSTPIWEVKNDLFSLFNIAFFVIIYGISFFFTILIIGLFRFIFTILNIHLGSTSTNKEINEGNYQLDELRQESICNNNSIMYQEYKELKGNKNLKEYMSYFYFFGNFLLFYDAQLFENGVWHKLKNLNDHFAGILSIINMILFFYFTWVINYNSDYTGIKKVVNKSLES